MKAEQTQKLISQGSKEIPKKGEKEPERLKWPWFSDCVERAETILLCPQNEVYSTVCWDGFGLHLICKNLLCSQPFMGSVLKILKRGPYWGEHDKMTSETITDVHV